MLNNSRTSNMLGLIIYFIVPFIIHTVMQESLWATEFAKSIPEIGSVVKGEPWIKGVFCISPVDSLPPASLFNSNTFAGLSIYLQWKDVEPNHEKYTWDKVDAVLEYAKKNGKKVIFAITPGIGTPPWVYGAGAKKFTFKSTLPHREFKPDEKDIPIPWDATFLKLWIDFIHTFGMRYSKNPTIILIKMGGANWQDEEMNLPHKDLKDIKAWKEAGYSKDVLVETWQKIIDVYAASFPHTAIGISVAIPMGRDSWGVVEKVVGSGVEKYGHRLVVQYNSISDKETMSDIETGPGFLYDIVRRQSSKATIGFQTKIVSLRGDFSVTVDRASKAGAHYLELHKRDCLDPENKPIIIRFLETQGQ